MPRKTPKVPKAPKAINTSKPPKTSTPKLTGLANALTRGKKNATARAAITRAMNRSPGSTLPSGTVKVKSPNAMQNMMRRRRRSSRVR